eukprot:m.682817 g.682817  ORF g.682817 m.682817 type:complete len:193 (+) comp22823_c0_seq14:239-817(+)
MGLCCSCEEPESALSTEDEEEPLITDETGNNGRRSRSSTPYGRFDQSQQTRNVDTHARYARRDRLQHLSSLQPQSQYQFHQDRHQQHLANENALIEKAKRITVLEELPVSTCTAAMVSSISESTHPECSICMCDYDVGQELRFLPCMHVYHRACVDAWLLRVSRCPECDKSLLEEDGAVDAAHSDDDMVSHT